MARILLDCSPTWRTKILEVVDSEFIEDDRVRRLLADAEAIEETESGESDFLGELLRRCTDPEVSTLIAELNNAPMPEVTDEKIRRQLQALLQKQAREGARRLTPRIIAAEKRGDTDELERLLAEKTRLRQNSTEI